MHRLINKMARRECPHGRILDQYQEDIKQSFSSYEIIQSSAYIGLEKTVKKNQCTMTAGASELMNFVQTKLARLAKKSPSRTMTDDQLVRFMDCVCCIVLMLAMLYSDHDRYSRHRDLLFEGLDNQQKAHWQNMLIFMFTIVTERNVSMTGDEPAIDWNRQTCFTYLAVALFDLFDICHVDVYTYISEMVDNLGFGKRLVVHAASNFLSKSTSQGFFSRFTNAVRDKAKSVTLRLTERKFGDKIKSRLEKFVSNALQQGYLTDVTDVYNKLFDKNTLTVLAKIANNMNGDKYCIIEDVLSLMPVFIEYLEGILHEKLIRYSHVIKCVLHECQPKRKTLFANQDMTVPEPTGVILGRASTNPFGDKALSSCIGFEATRQDLQIADKQHRSSETATASASAPGAGALTSLSPRHLNIAIQSPLSPRAPSGKRAFSGAIANAAAGKKKKSVFKLGRRSSAYRSNGPAV